MPSYNNGTSGGKAGLERSTSQLSTASHRSGTVRSRSRKQSLVTPTSAKSLVSFPSLSPENSPSAAKNGNFIPPLPQPTSQTPRKPSTKRPSIVDTLITKTPSFRGRTALFEESPKASPKEVPGALHLASDEYLQKTINKTGAVALVRQLAEDLAYRDLEITSLRRRAEERERELKAMLREVEVSNLDIDIRLHRIGNLSNETSVAGSRAPSTKVDYKMVGGRERIQGVTSGIYEMMGEAMDDDVAINSELDENYLDSLNIENRHATIKAGANIPRELNGVSNNSSIGSNSRPSNTVRGWKDYIWSGAVTSRKTSRASSIHSDHDDEIETVSGARGGTGGNVRRRGLDEDLFHPPQRSSASPNSTDARSRKSSTSVASWTMKLFAGNPLASRDSESHATVRGRSVTTGSGATRISRAASNGSTQTASSAFEALMKVNSNGSDSRTTRKNVQNLRLGPNGVSKTVPQASSSQMPGSPKSVDTASNLGPVEMDTILPPNSRPPTQMRTYNDNQSSEFLTDRFGFIYDQRRRKREADTLKSATEQDKQKSVVEMLNGARDTKKSLDIDVGSAHSRRGTLPRPESPASVDDKTNRKPTKRWQDYLKVATFPTELLSHTPASNPITAIAGADRPSRIKRSPTFGDARGSLPSTSLNPEPLASPITAGNAEIAKPVNNASAALSSPAAEMEPVKVLLAQLTELHDSLQRDKTVKWNEFLRKVRAERKKEGETAASTDSRSKQATMPEVALTDGEMIGVAGLGNKGKGGQAKWKEFKQLVLAGVPVTYRAKIWAECSGASALRVPGYYDDLVSNGIDDPVILVQIQMDINRTLTDNVYFRKGPGVAKLNEVLLAYSRRNPEVGYCQGMNLITASLLLIMPTAEDAFWVLTSIVENILPRHYYDHSLLASRADQQVLRQYVSEILPKISTHLDNLGIELEALTFQWFLSVFTDCLSAEALYRVWDVVLCFNDGSTFLFQVALALLKLNEGQLLACETAAGVYGYIGHEMTDHAISIDGLIRASEGLRKVVRRKDVESRRARAVEEERERERGVGSGDDGKGELKIREPRPIDEEVPGQAV